MTSPSPQIPEPGLVYHTAFDICAVMANSAGGPAALLTSSIFYTRELVKRAPGKVYLFPCNGWVPQPDPEVERERVIFARTGDALPDFNTAIWAEPQKTSTGQAAEILKNRMQADGLLLIIRTNGLRFLLPEWKSAQRPDQPGWLSLAEVERQLYGWGFRSWRLYGFQGPVSLAYGFLARWAGLINRQDLVDRCLAGMRRSLLTQGFRAALAPVALLVARKGP